MYKKCYKIRNVHIYISLDTDKDYNLLYDRLILTTGRMPHDK